MSSIGSLGGILNSAAGAPLAQTKGSEVERSQQDQTAQQRQVQGELRAETAASIGETDGEEHQTADRDADGRQLWQRSHAHEKADAEVAPEAPRSKDVSGQTGSQLDLSG
jgi:hypothetical protein